MNYAEARKLSDGSGWHFTVQNDDRIWTHQCCRDPGPPATEEDAEKYGYEVGEPTLGKAHAPHATREEAEDCYRQWCLAKVEETLAFSDDVFPNWHGCEAVVEEKRCDTPTKGGARYNADHWPEHVPLCADHRTKEAVLAQVKVGTRSAYS